MRKDFSSLKGQYDTQSEINRFSVNLNNMTMTSVCYNHIYSYKAKPVIAPFCCSTTPVSTLVETPFDAMLPNITKKNIKNNYKLTVFYPFNGLKSTISNIASKS